MKCFAIVSLFGAALSTPQYYGLGAYPYALPYAAYNPLASGIVYPAAAPYVHDASGDEAPAYVHDASGDARKKRDADAQLLGYPYAHPYAVYNPLASGIAYPLAAPYVHDASGDEAPAYVHDPTGDARKKRDADAQVLGYPYALPYNAYNPFPSGTVYPVAAPYVHDTTGDEAPAYVHDTTGDARKKRDADAQVLGYPYAIPYAAYNPLASGLVYPIAAPYVHDASGDEAPAYVHDTAGDARKKRDADADAQVLYGGYPYAYGYAGLPYGLPIAPLVAHPNGAVVPLEPADVVKARADHLAAVSEALSA